MSPIFPKVGDKIRLTEEFYTEYKRVSSQDSIHQFREYDPIYEIVNARMYDYYLVDTTGWDPEKRIIRLNTNGTSNLIKHKKVFPFSFFDDSFFEENVPTIDIPSCPLCGNRGEQGFTSFYCSNGDCSNG